jgi:excisionase family DNA binding protein
MSVQFQEVEHAVVAPPVVVKVGTAAKMLDAGLTTVYRLIAAGKLKTVMVGKDKRVTVASINALAEGE